MFHTNCQISPTHFSLPKRGASDKTSASRYKARNAHPPRAVFLTSETDSPTVRPHPIDQAQRRGEDRICLPKGLRQSRRRMSSFYEKMDFILKEEERFALTLALEVVEKPKLSMWMVLIPFIFLYFFYQYKKTTEGRKAFVNGYLVSRRRALEESFQKVKHRREPDIDSILKESALPEGAKGAFREFFSLLLEHYSDLLQSDGSDAGSLVRTAYRNRTHYLLFLNRLNQTENELYRAIRENMGAGEDGIDAVVRKLEVASERLRRESAERLFP